MDISTKASKGKQKSGKKVNRRSSYNLSYKEVFSYPLVILISVFLITIPFFRGLYFRENYIPAIIIISCIFMLVFAIMPKVKKLSIVENYVDITILLLVFSYFMSFLFGISKMDSLDGLLKYIGAFLLYKCVYHLTKYGKYDMQITYMFIGSGFVTSLFSMLGAAEVIKLDGVFGWGDRLNGLYQYPNSTASVLAAIFLLNIIVIIGHKKPIGRLVCFVSAATILLAFLETRSRGGLLVLGLAWLLQLILLKGHSKLYHILYSGLAAAGSLLSYANIYNTFIEKKGFLGAYALFLLIVVFLGCAMEYLKRYADKLKESMVNKTILALAAVCVVAVVSAFNITEPLKLYMDKPSAGYEIYSVKPDTVYTAEFSASNLNQPEGDFTLSINSVNNTKLRTSVFNQQYIFDKKTDNSIEFMTVGDTVFITLDFINNKPDSGLSIGNFVIKDKNTGEVVEKLKLQYKFIPDDIAKKINEISLKTESSSERIVFIKDGLKIFKDYFLFGTGAKGWSHLYNRYQSYGYVSNEAHNYYLQTAIESGVLGILSLILLFAGLVYVFYRTYRNSKENNYIVLGTAVMIFSLLAHAFIDFDFSLYAILLLLFAAIGVYMGVADTIAILPIGQKLRKGMNISVIALLLLVFVITSAMYSGMVDGNKASKLVNSNVSESKKLYEKALGKAFYNMAYTLDYSQLLLQEAKKTGDKGLIQQVYNNYKLVEKNDPYKVSFYSVILNFYLSNGYIKDAQALMNRLIEIQPFKPENYELKANINHDLMNLYHGQKNYKEALECANEILETENQYNDAIMRIATPFELTTRTNSIIRVAKQRKEMLEERMK